jgi:hypothetical protein
MDFANKIDQSALLAANSRPAFSMQCEKMHIDAAPFILQFIMPTLQVAIFTMRRRSTKQQDPVAKDAWHKRCFKPS